jgi:hypothetical protein
LGKREEKKDGVQVLMFERLIMTKEVILRLMK